MDGGFLPWHSALDLNALKNVLINLHPTIKFAIESAKFDKFSKTSVIHFLEITVLLHENGYIETDIFYKETNTHDYLNYNSHHSNHIKHNIPFNLEKRILILESGKQKVALRLKELRKWLLNCAYSESVIDKSFFSAKLQGPANKPANSKNMNNHITSCRLGGSTEKFDNHLLHAEPETRTVFSNTCIYEISRRAEFSIS